MILRNYYTMLSYAQLLKSPVVIDPNGDEKIPQYQFVDIPVYMKYMRQNYNSGPGLVIGTSNAPENYYDFCLAGNLITNFTYSYTLNSNQSSNGAYIIGNYTITNNNTEAITIKEVGLLGRYINNDTASCLIERTVLKTPITIEAGGVGQLEYKIHMEIPTQELDNLDEEGIYGVSFNFATQTFTRLGSAKNFSNPIPATSYDTIGSSSFDSIMPWSGMKKYNIIDNIVSYSEDDEEFDEINNDTMVYIPDFYYKVQYDPYVPIIEWAISNTSRDGFEKHPGSGRYVSKYQVSMVNNIASSKANQIPISQITRPNARNNSHSKGDQWWLIDIASWSAIQLLYLIEFADWDSQKTLGCGNNTGSVISTGRTNGALYHTVQLTGNSNQYRWIENPFSNLFIWIDGIMNNSSSTTYIGLDNNSFTDSINNLQSTGLTYNSENYYITKLAYIKKFPWLFLGKSGVQNYANAIIPDIGRSQPNFFPRVGGGPENTSEYGIFYYQIYWTATENPQNTGYRLIYIP